MSPSKRHAGADLVKRRIGQSERFGRAEIIEKQCQTTHDFPLSAAAVSVRVDAAAPHTDADRFPATRRDQGQGVLEALQMSNEGDDLGFDQLAEGLDGPGLHAHGYGSRIHLEVIPGSPTGSGYLTIGSKL